MIRLSLQPSPASETSAFNRIRAFSNRWAGLFPFRIRASSCSRSSAFNRTTYFFTEISFATMIASVARPSTVKGNLGSGQTGTAGQHSRAYSGDLQGYRNEHGPDPDRLQEPWVDEAAAIIGGVVERSARESIALKRVSMAMRTH